MMLPTFLNLRVLRQDRWVRMCLVEIFHDGDRLEQDSVALVERRQQHLRVHLLVRVLPLLALQQIDADDLVRHDALEIERDAYPKRRKRSPERIEFHEPPP